MDKKYIEKLSFDDITESFTSSDPYVDCLIPKLLTFKLESAKKFLRYLNEKFYTDAYEQTQFSNGQGIEYTSTSLTNPVRCVKLKNAFNPEDKIVYKVNVYITIDVPLLVSEQAARISNIPVDRYSLANVSELVMYKLLTTFSDKCDESSISFTSLFSGFYIYNIKFEGFINIADLPNRDVNTYMKLLASARQYRHMNPICYWDNKEVMRLKFPSYTIDISYGDELYKSLLNNSHFQSADSPDVELKYKNKIRFLYSLSGKYITVKYGDGETMKCNKHSLLLSMRRAYIVFTEMMSFLYTTNDFYSAPLAISRINESSYHSDTKDNLCSYVTYCSRIKRVIENSELFKIFFNVEYSNAYSNMLKKFNKIGISTIIVPETSKAKLFKNPLVYMYCAKRSIVNK